MPRLLPEMNKVRMRPWRRLALAVALVLSQGAVVAANYNYADVWWEEYRNDRQTTLLLHFGPEQKIGAVAIKQAAATAAKANLEFVDLDLADNSFGDLGLDRPTAGGPPPVDEASLPANTIADYSDNRRRFLLPQGFALVEHGRFGRGLACHGERAWRLERTQDPQRRNSVQMVELWLRVDALPAETACIISIADDESRILLHPDGRLELKLRRPHGIVSDRHNTAEQIRQILARDATIISRDPQVMPGQWVHIAAWNRPIVVQGASSPFNATLLVNGRDVARYQSENSNGYLFLGRGAINLTLGANAEGSQAFTGIIDEVRVSHDQRNLLPRDSMAWADPQAERQLHFDKPYFRADGTVFHASLDSALAYERGQGQIAIDLRGVELDNLLVPGVRGHGWAVTPNLGFPRFALTDMDARDGTLEFWLRPTNWDNTTRFWPGQTPPNSNLSVARIYGRDRRNGKETLMLEVTLPHATEHDHNRASIDPGHWNHVAVTWTGSDLSRATLHVNGRSFRRLRRADPETLPHLEPLYVEFGVSNNITVARQEPPAIEIDEIVGYNYALDADELQQARRRWQTEIEPIDLAAVSHTYRYSLNELEYVINPKLPPNVEADFLTATLRKMPETSGADAADGDGDGVSIAEFERITLADNRFLIRHVSEPRLEAGRYRFDYQIVDTDGKTVYADRHLWNYHPEPWRDNQIGILAAAPPPWTPIRVDGNALHTRMTTYIVGANGLPAEIHVAGENILAAPLRLLEAGKPMRLQGVGNGDNRNVQYRWQTRFAGESCTVVIENTLEYDGMLKYEISIEPLAADAVVLPLTLEIPVARASATHGFVNRSAIPGVGVSRLPIEGVAFASRYPQPGRDDHQQFERQRQQQPQLTWQQFWQQKCQATEQYGFFTQIDVNNRERGLYWFADNGIGWGQAKQVSAQKVTVEPDAVVISCRIIAQPMPLTDTRPIVFGLLPHPARPIMPQHRLLNRAPADQEPLLSDLFGSVFRSWARDPKARNMALYPAVNPDNPEAGPCWEYAESCIPQMRRDQQHGFRTIYLSHYWYSCRAGAYDNWEWRTHESKAFVTRSFVDYLCWEMNEWIGRGIFNAIYLDELYEAFSRNVRAGQAVRLPDGSVQPGVSLFMTRELLKRWRNLFHQHGLEPMLVDHHTGSWMYGAGVFTDAYLDGEGRPIITAKSRDFVDSLPLARAEVLQNGALWGKVPFYMVSIWEGGLESGKDWNPHKVWSWRMARAAMSLLAHFENGTAYTDQGEQVYRSYWRDLLSWGAGDPVVTFHPYHANSRYLKLDGQGDEAMVSFYRQGDRILLIASNRSNEPRDLKITFDAQTLRRFTQVAARDSSYEPPQGDDIVSSRELAAIKPTAAAIGQGNDPFGEQDVMALLEGEEGMAKKAAATVQPRLTDNVLILPTRAKDFRIVELK